jgi:diguanylate cyclase (GGDEF)-like protein
VRLREEAERAARALSRHDALTGLPNRRVFTEALQKATDRARRGQSECAVLLFDLNRFKPINDVHGHATGDIVLRTIAERLSAILRRDEIAARLGGDEFGIVLECAPGSDAPLRMARRVEAGVAKPIHVNGIEISTGAAIGIAIAPADGHDPETLMHAADIAMYRAKTSRQPHCFFELGMDAEAQARSELERDLRQAIAAGQIVPFYQPLMSLDREQLLGFEILARWNHPTRGIVPPDQFIPIAEDTSLIGEITYSLLRQACRQALSWPSHLILAVNIAPSQLKDPNFVTRILGILRETGIAPQRLEVEITETALVTDLEAAKTALEALQGAGVSIALDDFGTGYSSLYHLRELHFDKIKIDRSFVLSLHRSEESAKIIEAIVSLGKSLGMPAVAEGIETRETLNELVQLGCKLGQGYLFSAPVPASKLEQLLDWDAAARRRAQTKNVISLRK